MNGNTIGDTGFPKCFKIFRLFRCTLTVIRWQGKFFKYLLYCWLQFYLYAINLNVLSININTICNTAEKYSNCGRISWTEIDVSTLIYSMTENKFHRPSTKDLECAGNLWIFIQAWEIRGRRVIWATAFLTRLWYFYNILFFSFCNDHIVLDGYIVKYCNIVKIFIYSFVISKPWKIFIPFNIPFRYLKLKTNHEQTYIIECPSHVIGYHNTAIFENIQIFRSPKFPRRARFKINISRPTRRYELLLASI